MIDHFLPRVTAELDRLEAEMRTAFAGCTTFWHTYDVAYHLKTPGPWALEAVALGFVQVRTVAGSIHSVVVWEGLGTGEVWVTGWPVEAGSGWVRG